MWSPANSLDARGRDTVDRILVAALLVFELVVIAIALSRRENLSSVQRTVLLGVTPLLPLPLLLRRRNPGPVLIALAVLTTLIWLADVDTTTAITGTIGLYSLGRWEDARRSLRWWLATLAILLPTGIISALMYPGSEMWFQFASRASVLLGFYWLGVSFRSKADAAEALHARAIRAEHDAQAERDRAVSAERSRIAAEMHDVISHSVTVMVVQSDVASRLVHTDPSAAQQSMGHVSATGRAALAELRSMLQVLGDATDNAVALHPQPTAAAIADLVANFRSAGMQVSLDYPTNMGAGSLPEPTSRCAYRVVQEALTNAMKHALGAPVEIVLVETPAELTIAVTNGPTSAPRIEERSGFGLLGMAERVKTSGGTLHHGYTADGGYRVVATLPLTGAATS
jgi:signal transduction histidine kinase